MKGLWFMSHTFMSLGWFVPSSTVLRAPKITGSKMRRLKAENAP
jgi:hypothetical protein